MLMGFPGLPAEKAGTPEESDIFHFTHVNDLPVTARDIAAATKKDPVLSKVLQLVKCGWPQQVQEEALDPYFKRRLNCDCDFLTVFCGGCESLSPGNYRTGSLKTFMLITQGFAV